MHCNRDPGNLVATTVYSVSSSSCVSPRVANVGHRSEVTCLVRKVVLRARVTIKA